jgi:serine phosphatase RsbU (regulator of sigma subunit)
MRRINSQTNRKETQVRSPNAETSREIQYELEVMVHNYRIHRLLSWGSLLVASWLLTTSSFAKPIPINTSFTSQLVGLNLEQYTDPDGTKSLADILDHEVDFSPVNTPIPYFSYNSSTYWFRFTLDNQLAKATHVYLQIACAWIDQLTLFIPTAKGAWQQKNIGHVIPFNDREVDSILPTFKIHQEGRSQKTYYLRVKSEDALILPFYLKSEDQYHHDRSIKEFISGLFFGLLGVMFFYNLIVYIFSADRAYVVYSFNIAAWFAMFFTIYGYSFAWLWPDNTWWSNRANVVTIAMSTLSGGWFAKEFLNTKRIAPQVDRWLKIWIGCQLALAGSAFVVPYRIAMITAASFGAMFGPFLFFSGLIMLRKGFKPARYYVASWFFPSFATLAYMTFIFGLVPPIKFSIYVLHGGVALEVIMLSVALGDRMRQMTQQNQDLKVSLETARVVQESFLLLDTYSPTIETDFWYQPCETLGGDWLACLESKDQKRLYIALGDVTGHGIATSLITGAAVGSFRTAVYQLASTADLKTAAEDIANQLNEALLAMGAKKNTFMTMALVVVDLETLEAVYLNAGHVYIFIKTPAKVRATLRRGSPLGVSKRPRFGIQSINLSEACSLILYSDGLIENQLAPDRWLTLNELVTTIKDCNSDQQFLASLREQFMASQNQAWDDDCTVLTVHLRRCHSDKLPISLKPA